MSQTTLRFKRLDDTAKIPQTPKPGDVGYDLYSLEDTFIPARTKKIVRTGVAVEIPDGYYGRVASRSGLSVKNSIEVGAGVIDSNYRNELMVVLYNHSDNEFTADKHARIAQLILEKCAVFPVEEVTELSDTNRGLKGLGSSGLY